MTKKILMISALFALLFASCTNDTQNADNQLVTEESLGLRKTDLYSEQDSVGAMATYSTAVAGQSELIERSFENAPPLIPHTVVGFLPIKIKSNACLSCHMPKVAEAAKATAIPRSHFTDYRIRPKKTGKVYEIAANNETAAEDLGDELSRARFNCSQCHVPQANITVAVENTFQANFRNEESKKKSNFVDTYNEGVK